ALLGVRGMERGLHHPRLVPGAADLDGQSGAYRGLRRWHVAHADRALDRGAERAGGHDAHRGVARHQAIAVPRHRALDHLEAHQLAADATRAQGLDRLAPDEVALGRLHYPAEAGLEGIGGLVDVVAVERVLHLEPQGVARAEPGRLCSVVAPRLSARLRVW